MPKWKSPGLLWNQLRPTQDTITTANIDTLVSGTAITKFTETVAYDAFTDGGGAAGTYVITAGTIPVGAFFLAATCTNITGFTGDVSAAITIGDGSTADRYLTGTPTVFTTAANGIALGIPSGVQYHVAAGTITVTVTSNAAFANVSAGSVTLEFYYIT